MTQLRRLVCILVIAAAAGAALPVAAQRGPAAEPSRLPADVLGLACAPALTSEPSAATLRVTGNQDSVVRRVFLPGDLVTINAGAAQGMEVGREYYVRRTQVPPGQRPTALTPGVIRTVGWVRVWAVEDAMSLATITHACDTIETDDYLEPFALPVVPAAGPRPKPERGNYGRVVIGNDRRIMFGRDDYLIVDRGASHGVAPGAQFVVYRDKHQTDNFLFELGEAVAVDVRPETSTLRVTISRDALLAGDLVAIRREP